VRVSDTSENANRRRAPNTGSGIQSLHLQAFLEYDARTEESHTGHDIRRDPPHGRWVALNEISRHNESGSPRRHEGMGSRARHAPMPLPLDADGGAQQKCNAEPQCVQAGIQWFLMPLLVRK
jgi:hypothetical protein